MNDSLIELDLSDRDELYRVYMPSIRNGAVFVRTNTSYRLGDAVHLLLTLADEPEPIRVDAVVVWITPGAAQGNRPAGIGVRFDPEDKGMTRKKIETQLATLLSSDKPTYTI
jgi:type IV pilus assembly protein PilZ